MKILATSDLHIDYSQLSVNGSIIKTLQDFLQQKSPDCFVIAGDISSDMKLTVSIIDELNKIVPTYWVPGNHDLWTTDSSSWPAYRMAEDHATCLCGSPVVFNDHVIIGDVGWYDYTLGSVKVNLEEFSYLKDKLWMDGKFCKFEGMTDPEICNHMIKKLDYQIKQYEDKKIISH